MASIRRSVYAMLAAMALIGEAGSVLAGQGSRWFQGLSKPSQGFTLLVAQRGASISPDAAAERAAGATGGRVLGVRRREASGEPLYEVKVLLPGGRVRMIRIDANTGQVLY